MLCTSYIHAHECNGYVHDHNTIYMVHLFMCAQIFVNSVVPEKESKGCPGSQLEVRRVESI